MWANDLPVPEQAKSDIAAALGCLGSPPVEIAPITTLPSASADRGNFLVHLASGERVKLVLFGTDLRCREVAHILRALRHRHLTRPLAHHGRALVTEWVAGAPLPPGDLAILEACGAVLGSIHAVSVPAGLPPAPRRQAELSDGVLSKDLDALVARGALGADIANAALRLAEDSAPSESEAGFTHRDFCPENLLIDEEGLVRAIDNDSMACDALDYDLARWWYRWPMPAPDREAFLRGYATYRSPLGFRRHSGYWMVLAIVRSIEFRVRAGSAQVNVPVAALAALLHRSPPE